MLLMMLAMNAAVANNIIICKFIITLTFDVNFRVL